jgi:hypothetical protein
MSEVRKNSSPALWVTLVLGLLGVGASYALSGAERFWANWVLWFVYLLTISLGALFIVALEHLVGARWSVVLRRVPERLSTMLLMLVPVALVALGAVLVIYPGARPEAAQNKILAGKAFWLSFPFFSSRTVLFLVLWLIGLAVLVRGSLKQDESKDPAFNVRARRFAPLFMAFFAFGVTMVAFDWISGLEPEWYSDIFGVYLFAGSFLSGLAATALAIVYLQRRGRLPGVKRDHLYNVGGFMFAFTVFWSYIGFAQYMLMWYGDMPEEIFWYKERIQGPWLALVGLIVLLNFVIPFFALIPRDVKGDTGRLRWVAALMLAGHLLDLYWLIFPSLGKGVLLSWPELSFALFFGSAALLWVRRAMEVGQDMPVGDPFLQEGLEFRL